MSVRVFVTVIIVFLSIPVLHSLALIFKAMHKRTNGVLAVLITCLF